LTIGISRNELPIFIIVLPIPIPILILNKKAQLTLSNPRDVKAC